MHPDAIRTALTPVVAEFGLSLYDVEVVGTGKARTLQVLVNRAGGIDLEAVATATRAVSEYLDTLDPIGGTYTLEVSSPGLERPLRRAEHFVGATGETVSVKFRDADGVIQRVRGVVSHATADGCTVEADGTEHQIPYTQLVAAHTVFEWGAEERTRGPKDTKSKARATSK